MDASLRTFFAATCGDGGLRSDPRDRGFASPSRIFSVAHPARAGSYASSFFHIRSTVAAIKRARLSFASVGFVPPVSARS